MKKRNLKEELLLIIEKKEEILKSIDFNSIDASILTQEMEDARYLLNNNLSIGSCHHIMNNTTSGSIYNLIKENVINVEQFVEIKDWKETYDNLVNYFIEDDGPKVLIIPVTDNKNLNSFDLSSKKAYARLEMRERLAKYISYFMKFYDIDRELMDSYLSVREITNDPNMNIDDFINAIYIFIVKNKSLRNKIYNMNCDNVSSLIRNRNHVLSYMGCSLIMKLCIPLITEYLSIKGLEKSSYDIIYRIFKPLVESVNEYLYEDIKILVHASMHGNINENLEIYKLILKRYTTLENYENNCIMYIIVNIIPKFEYNHNPITFLNKAADNLIKFENICYKK